MTLDAEPDAPPGTVTGTTWTTATGQVTRAPHPLPTTSGGPTTTRAAVLNDPPPF